MLRYRHSTSFRGSSFSQLKPLFHPKTELENFNTAMIPDETSHGLVRYTTGIIMRNNGVFPAKVILG